MSSEALKIPVHVAIIMDGNGRWARQRGLSRIEGHRAGVQAVRETVRSCRRLGVKVLTLYAFSKENWKRPRLEIAGLMRLLSSFLKSEIREMQENGIRLGTIGDVSDPSPGVVKTLDRARRETAGGNEMQLNLALSYGGRDEILRGVRRILSEVREGTLDPRALSEEAFGRYLDTAGLPDPDLVIRTSNEMRISNFLLWQMAYAEIYVTEVLWPDFREADLLEAFRSYSRRKRRFGGVEPNGAI